MKPVIYRLHQTMVSTEVNEMINLTNAIIASKKKAVKYVEPNVQSKTAKIKFFLIIRQIKHVIKHKHYAKA